MNDDRQPSATLIRERHLTAVLRGIRNVNRLIIAETDPVRLIERACESLSDAMGYHNAWITLFGGEAGRALGLSDQGAVSATAAAGLKAELGVLRAQLERTAFPQCMERAMKTGELVVTVDLEGECPPCPLSGDYGGRAGLACRLEAGGVTYGILAASVPASFSSDTEEKELFFELAADLAFGLHQIALARRLRTNEAWFQNLFKNHSAVILIINPDDGRIVEANASAAEFYGWSVAQLGRMKITEINTLSPAQVSAEMEKALRLDRRYFEFRHRRADGSVRDVAVYSSKVNTAGKDLLYSMIHDITEVIQLKDAQRRADERFRVAQDMSPDGFTILHPVRDASNRVIDFAWVYENAAIARLNGTDPAAVVGRRLLDLFPGHRGTTFFEAYQRVAESGEPCVFEQGYSGESLPHPIWFRIVVVPMEEDLAILAQDITERKTTENELLATNQQLRAIEQQLRASNQQIRATNQQLVDSEERFRQVYENVVTGIARVSLDMRIEQANEAYCEMLGYSEAELLGLHLRDITRPEVLEENLQLQARLVAGEINHYRMEKTFLRKDGQVVHGILDASLVRTEQGAPAYCLGSVVDITERKRVDQLLLSERDRFLAVMETAPVALLIADHRECITEANRAAKVLFGPVGGVPGGPLRCGDFIGCVHRAESPEGCGHGPACSRCEVYSALRKALAGETVHDLETEVHVEKGRALERRIILLHAAPLSTGERPGAILAANDITDMRNLHATMAQSDRLSSMGMLAAGVAHEINNPLSYVLYNLESLSEDLPRLLQTVQENRPLMESSASEEDLLTRFRDALDGTHRIRDIARGLGTFSRVERENAVLVDLAHVMDVAANMATNEIKYRARLVKDYSPIPTVLASEGRLSQVFLNLIINATHAIDEGDVENNAIFLKTWSENGMACAEVRDTGSGIAPEHLDKLFEPFFTTKKVGKGSGLGLAISRNIIESYGGFISVKSNLGHGTTFVIRLPARAGATGTTDQEVSRADVAPSIRGRILIIDDEAGIRAAMARLLREHETVQATSGLEAKGILQQDQSFHLILCDMMMPDLSGMDLHQWLLEFNPELAGQLIFITGGAFTPRAADYLSQVDNIRLEKPFDVARFKKIIMERLVIAQGLRAS